MSFRAAVAAVLLLSSTFSGTARAADGDAALEIVVGPLRSAQGQLRASLYRDAASFRKEAQAMQRISLPAREGELRLRFEGLAPGRYAVMVYHDENANEKLDLRFGMLPIEGYGLSRNPKVIGPPKFEDSALELGGGQTAVAIELRY